MADQDPAPKIRDEDRTYDPSTPEANRSAMQGNGAGARDIAAQQDPTREPDRDPFRDGVEADEGEGRQEGSGAA